MRDLRVPGALLVLALAGVVTSTILFLFAAFPGGDPATIVVYWTTTTVGYLCAGVAGWRWVVRTDGDVRGPTRWMAAAALVTAAGMAALANQVYQNNHVLSLSTVDLHYVLRLTSDVVGAAGFLCAAVGFWLASTAGRTTSDVSAAPRQPSKETV